MKLYLLGTYDYADTHAEVGLTANMTDEITLGSQNAGQERDLYGFILLSNDAFVEEMWLTEYSLINRANRLIEGASRITPTPAEEAEYNSIVAHAKALRAYGHFQLLTYFSTDLSNDSALGVCKVDHVPSITEKLPRSTNGEVFALIESDLNDAYANLVDYTTATAPNTHPWTFFSKNAVNAFRARMYLYRKNYALALQYADQVIAAGPALAVSNTGLPAGTVGSTAWNNAFYSQTTFSNNPYKRMFTDPTGAGYQGEIILSFEMGTSKSAVAGLFYFNRTQFSGGPYHEMDRNVFNLLEQNTNAAHQSNDIRRYVYIDPTSKIDQPGYTGSTAPYFDTDGNYKFTDVLCIDKYPGKVGTNRELQSDYKIFRMSEMYFIRAEALIAAGDLTGAANAVQAVRIARTFRNSPPALPVYANATAAWADVLLERRLELYLEGHRYIDLKRLGTLANAGIDRYSRDCEQVNVCSIPTTDTRFTAPIPIREMNANPQMEQNPGYDQ
ncbi:RagB/SusD family nutrient uptake outer membrane protein [Flavobacterium wongokense]|uniref:RagB/SusD family nutrient uptake outer membrane protein n=1 Tax=Flavobacterium wongokense TaxID=2910674 RepID=UPI001F3AC37B|nr:RagB/SusD family nutrient uptake outer membrane protein [Flavobacterium sp. WG47]MCF6130844.1 RagB/SusD family nutrient uptake outer membrane protein [Flavobacterium sp. WG47]